MTHELPEHIIEELAREIVAKHGGSYSRIVEQIRVFAAQTPTVRKILMNVDLRVLEAIKAADEQRRRQGKRPFKRTTPVRKIIGDDELKRICEIEWACGQAGLTKPNQ